MLNTITLNPRTYYSSFFPCLFPGTVPFTTTFLPIRMSWSWEKMIWFMFSRSVTMVGLLGLPLELDSLGLSLVTMSRGCTETENPLYTVLPHFSLWATKASKAYTLFIYIQTFPSYSSIVSSWRNPDFFLVSTFTLFTSLKLWVNKVFPLFIIQAYSSLSLILQILSTQPSPYKGSFNLSIHWAKKRDNFENVSSTGKVKLLFCVYF